MHALCNREHKDTEFPSHHLIIGDTSRFFLLIRSEREKSQQAVAIRLWATMMLLGPQLRLYHWFTAPTAGGHELAVI